VKFVVEFSDESIKRCFDPRCVINVTLDMVIVNELLENLGLPSEINLLLSSLLCNERVSYKNVINFAKVYSWIDQVFFPKYHDVLMPTNCPIESTKAACVLVLSVETVFGTITDELVEGIAGHYNTSSQLDILLYFTLDNVAKALFERSSRYLRAILVYQCTEKD
jgi:hypothetical protein